jgi:hypothetical protein
VLLALSIAIALLVVVLYYYQQAAKLRDSTLEAAAGLAAVRLCMDRLGTELRTASTQPDTFRGGPQDLEFLQCDLPEPSANVPGDAAGETIQSFALRRIRYALPTGQDLAPATGLVRTETALATPTSTAAAPTESSTSDPFASPDPTNPALLTTPLEEEPTEPTTPPDTNAMWAVESTSVTEEGTRLTTAFPSSGTMALAIPEIRFLRLRYYDGATWLDAWSATDLPRGVEITLALQPLAPESGPEALPGEVFRRTIALAAGPARVPDELGEAEFTDGWPPREDGP